MNYVSIIMYILCCYREVLNFTLSAPLSTCLRKKKKKKNHHRKAEFPVKSVDFFFLFVCLDHLFFFWPKSTHKFPLVSLVMRNRSRSLLFNCFWLLGEALLNVVWERTCSGYLKDSYYRAVFLSPCDLPLEPWRERDAFGNQSVISLFSVGSAMCLKQYFWFWDDYKYLSAAVAMPCSKYWVLLRGMFSVESVKWQDSGAWTKHAQTLDISIKIKQWS